MVASVPKPSTWENKAEESHVQVLSGLHSKKNPSQTIKQKRILPLCNFAIFILDNYRMLI